MFLLITHSHSDILVMQLLEIHIVERAMNKRLYVNSASHIFKSKFPLKIKMYFLRIIYLSLC